MKHRRTLLKVLLALACLLTGLAVAAWLYPRQVLTVESGPVSADVLVVLGGGSQARPQRAAELYRAGAAPKIIVSGAGDDGINAHCLETNGVPAAAILREGRSRSTYENAKFSIPLLRELGAKKVILVTSWYHSRRALKSFEHLAPEITFYSRPATLDDTGHVPRKLREEEQRYLRLEYPKLLGYWLRYGVWPF